MVWASGAWFKPGQFKIMRHIEEWRKEEQLLLDGVHKMLDEQESITPGCKNQKTEQFHQWPLWLNSESCGTCQKRFET